MPGRVSVGVGILVAGLISACGGESPDQRPVRKTASSVLSSPAISGGTLFIAADGISATVSDPDRDRIVIANLAKQSVVTEIPLNAGDEPGRATQDGEGRIHVVLRRGGALVTYDSASGLVTRRSVCAAPRGIAYDSLADLLHVACDTGELFSIAPTATVPTRLLELGRDLRDVIVSGGRIFVSRFRSAELIVLDANGAVEKTLRPTNMISFGTEFSTSVAWRTTSLPDGRLAMLHQGASSSDVDTQIPGGYGSGGGCVSSIVTTAVSTFDVDSTTPALPANPIVGAVTAVDVAVSHESPPRLALVAAGNNWANLQNLSIVAAQDVEQPVPDNCVVAQTMHTYGEAVAVAFDGNNRWVVQSRQPSRLTLEGGTAIDLGGDDLNSSGFALFHQDSGKGIACASCHPEGRDDGNVWSFVPNGRRRTQVPSGGILSTAPFHWNGEMTTFDMLAEDVFTHRMGGRSLWPAEVESLAKWLDARPAAAPKLVPAGDDAAVESGRTLFESAEVGCSSCHSGEKLTDNETYNVGTGGEFQVPSLIGVSARAPFLHNGCARTLYDRFDPSCGGGDAHGKTSGLSPEQVGDLVAYLERL